VGIVLLVGTYIRIAVVLLINNGGVYFMEKEIAKRRWHEPQISEIEVNVTGSGTIVKTGVNPDGLTGETGVTGSSITVK
jgi:hypothetical protein